MRRESVLSAVAIFTKIKISTYRYQGMYIWHEMSANCNAIAGDQNYTRRGIGGVTIHQKFTKSSQRINKLDKY